MRILITAAFVLASLLVSTASYAATDSIYKRVFRSRVVRCGYANTPPWVSFNPKTRDVVGAIPLYVTKLLETQKVKVEWIQYPDRNAVINSLNTFQIDMACMPLPQDVLDIRTHAGVAEVGMYFYRAYLPFKKIANKASLKNPRIAFIDHSDVADNLKSRFPLATFIKLSPTTKPKDLFDYLTYSKSDVVVADDFMAKTVIESGNKSFTPAPDENPITTKALYMATNVNARAWSEAIYNLLSSNALPDDMKFEAIAKTYNIATEINF